MFVDGLPMGCAFARVPTGKAEQAKRPAGQVRMLYATLVVLATQLQRGSTMFVAHITAS
jgi:hypothetical protein